MARVAQTVADFLTVSDIQTVSQTTVQCSFAIFDFSQWQVSSKGIIIQDQWQGPQSVEMCYNELAKNTRNCQEPGKMLLESRVSFWKKNVVWEDWVNIFSVQTFYRYFLSNLRKLGYVSLKVQRWTIMNLLLPINHF